MADDHSQRPYRSNELPVRGAPAAAPAPNSGGDPLAELARLIGQSDPFAEFGRDGARRGAAPRTVEPAADWSAQPAGAGYVGQTVAPDARAQASAPNFGANDYYGTATVPAAPPPVPEAAPLGSQNRARQPYANSSYAEGADLYRSDHEATGFPGARAGGYEANPYYPDKMQHAAEDEDLYDDVPPTRRRMGIMAIAAVFALAVIGTAGAFGYRALFGSSGSSRPTPVITADTTPSKIVPAAKSKDPQSGKLITDRVNDRAQSEKLVSREEQPVDMKDKPAGVIFPRGQDGAQTGAVQPALGSGVVAGEPKRVRTIAIHPDQPATADAMPVSGTAGAAVPPPERVTAVAPARQATPAPSPRVTSIPPVTVVDAAPRQPVAPTPVRNTAAHASSNAPLSLSPDAPVAAVPPARAAQQPMRTAAVPPPTQIAPSNGNQAAGGYAVQVSSQRSEAEAQASFHSLAAKFPGQLGGKQPLIHRVDLGAKGIYFRAMVGPFGNANEAGELCSSLKAAGGQCLVQRN